ncbi:MAG: AzlC family ABC transporter permease [Actinomycetota bacterium]
MTDLAPRSSPRASVRRHAIRDGVPLALGVLPFALVIGATIGSSDVDPIAALLGSILIFAGAAQLTAVELVDAGAAIPVIVFTCLLINARFVLYSARMASWFGAEPLRRRLALSAFVVDQSFLAAERRFAIDELDARERRSYFFTLGLFLWAVWVSAQVLGLLAGNRLPEGVGLELAAPLVFVGLLSLSLKDGRSWLVAGVAATVTLLASGAPLHAAVPIGTLAGIATGGATSEGRERTARRRPARSPSGRGAREKAGAPGPQPGSGGPAA